MGLVNIVIIEGLVEDSTDLDALQEAALDRCSCSAENRNIYDRDVLENLSLYPQHEPEPNEIACHLGPDQIGNWRAVAKVAAILSTRTYLEEEADEDLATLEGAVEECRQNGYDVTAIRAFCPNGWAIHERETAWQTGTLHEWHGLDDGNDSACLRVALSGKSEVWLELAPPRFHLGEQEKGADT